MATTLTVVCCERRRHTWRTADEKPHYRQTWDAGGLEGIPHPKRMDLEEPRGGYEVLRARKKDYPRPLLIHDRSTGGCGYSIDERDMKVYQGWTRNRRKRSIDPDWPTQEERERERWPAN